MRTIEELTKLKLFELREIARDLGISSPTALKKADLIDSILKVSSGEEKPTSIPRANKVVKEVSDKADESKEPVVTNEQVKSDDKNNSAESSNHHQNNQKKNKKPNPQNKNGQKGEELIREGYLDCGPLDSFGFLRAKQGENSELDAYIGVQKIRQYKLRRGDFVKAQCRVQQDGKPPAVINVLLVNGEDPNVSKNRKRFDDLTPLYPTERFRLEVPSKYNEIATRCIDLIAPIGKGQRAMIVSPPKAGKTTLLKMIANSLVINHPEIELYVLLIDERPEEVTDMQRSIKGQIFYSTFDERPENHTKTAELVLQKAKLQVEKGKDVVILMDSLTRLARAYNITISPTGRTLSGGIDPGALFKPKSFFGAARNIEEGGSLTIIATALIDTGSRMDDVIFEEFKGTGNMEIHLDRKLSERRIFPAIDLMRSGTRREELLLTQDELEAAYFIRQMLSANEGDSSENFISMIQKTKSNAEFIQQLKFIMANAKNQGFKFRFTPDVIK